MKLRNLMAAVRGQLFSGGRSSLLKSVAFAAGLNAGCQTGFVQEGAARGPSKGAMAAPAGLQPASAPGPGAPDAEAGEISGYVARSAGLAGRDAVGEVVFVVARDATTEQIVAVCRVEVAEGRPWPVPFSLRDHRLKAGAMVRLSARLDQDGSATTKQPGDEVGEVHLALKVPETDVVLTLDKAL